MTNRIEISSVSADKAKQWYSGLLKAIESLSEMPKRCALARENSKFSQEIRQLLSGRGRNVYRILFTVLETDEASNVRSLHIRHAYRQPLGYKPETNG
jgi:plasmid stabilization system protein ParE